MNNIKPTGLKTELDKDIQAYFNILVTAKQCLQYAEYLYNPDSQEEAQEINQNLFLSFARHLMLRTSIIELDKLYKIDKSGLDHNVKPDNYKFNLLKFLHKFKANGHFSKFIIDKTILQKWEERILLNENAIKKINALEDKVYAHTDSIKPAMEAVGLNFAELNTLICLAEDIIAKIAGDFLDREYDFATETMGSYMNIVKDIVVYRNKKTISLTNKLNSKKD